MYVIQKDPAEKQCVETGFSSRTFRCITLNFNLLSAVQLQRISGKISVTAKCETKILSDNEGQIPVSLSSTTQTPTTRAKASTTMKLSSILISTLYTNLSTTTKLTSTQIDTLLPTSTQMSTLHTKQAMATKLTSKQSDMLLQASLTQELGTTISISSIPTAEIQDQGQGQYVTIHEKSGVSKNSLNATTTGIGVGLAVLVVIAVTVATIIIIRKVKQRRERHEGISSGENALSDEVRYVTSAEMLRHNLCDVTDAARHQSPVYDIIPENGREGSCHSNPEPSNAMPDSTYTAVNKGTKTKTPQVDEATSTYANIGEAASVCAPRRHSNDDDFEDVEYFRRPEVPPKSPDVFAFGN